MEPQLSDALAVPIEISSTKDEPNAYSWKALAGSVIGYYMDGFDMLILGFMLAAISTDLDLTNSQAGSLVTWTLVGAVAGGVIFGTLSDHFGRIRILTWTILIFAFFTFLCGFARAIGTSMLEPGDAKVSCTVLRGLGDRKAARLLGSQTSGCFADHLSWPDRL
jgi:MFS family permease